LTKWPLVGLDLVSFPRRRESRHL